MASFGVELKSCKEVQKFVDKTNERLKGTNLLTNPFKEDSALLHLKDFLAIYIEPIYLNFPLYGACFVVPLMLYIKGFVWSDWHIPGIVFLALSFFWSKWFYYVMMRAGLRKGGYSGKIKIVRDKETIRRLIHYGAK